MKYAEVFTSCFSGEEFDRNLLPDKGDNKTSQYRASARASVARNFLGALLSKKGAIK